MREFTGRPQISGKAQSLTRGVNDLLEWKDSNNKMKENQKYHKMWNENIELREM